MARRSLKNFVTRPMAWYARCREEEGVLRGRLGRFVGADADEIALKISLSDGYGSVLWGLDWRPGDRVIVSDEEHPSPRLAVELAARRFGLDERRVLQVVG